MINDYIYIYMYNCRVMGTNTEDHVHVEIIVHPHEFTVYQNINTHIEMCNSGSTTNFRNSIPNIYKCRKWLKNNICFDYFSFIYSITGTKIDTNAAKGFYKISKYFGVIENFTWNNIWVLSGFVPNTDKMCCFHVQTTISAHKLQNQFFFQFYKNS